MTMMLFADGLTVKCERQVKDSKIFGLTAKKMKLPLTKIGRLHGAGLEQNLQIRGPQFWTKPGLRCLYFHEEWLTRKLIM